MLVIGVRSSCAAVVRTALEPVHLELLRDIADVQHLRHLAPAARMYGRGQDALYGRSMQDERVLVQLRQRHRLCVLALT